MSNSNNQIIVVGGGLAGLSAAHTVYENGGNVIVIDKNPFFGGNSTKATSGINGALTNTQIKQKIPDSAEIFYEDTKKSARDLLRPELVKVLTYNSGSAVEWLQNRFKIDLSLVSRLGGHSQPRTHRGKEKFPGMTITYGLMEKLEELSKTEPNRVKIMNKSRVVELIKENDTVIGCVYEKQGKKGKVYGPVILATGGYAADFTSQSLLKKYRPDLYELPTTNGDHCTGDGIKMALDIGCNIVDMEQVQVHPTGLVDPKEPDAKVKFLAAEALRGVGGLLINRDGKRFVDELQHRDFVTGKMWETNKFPIRLVLNSKAGKEIEWHIKHYMGRGLMKEFKSGADLAKEMKINPEVLQQTFEQYNNAAKNKNDEFGKKYFHNLPFNMNDKYYAALMTPVLHFTMGGVEINGEAEILDKNNKQVKGLFACGEMCGSVHGANRLGGSSLLACVVYGRVSGASAAKYQYQLLAQNKALSRLNNVGGHLSNGLKTTVQVFPEQNKMVMEYSWGDNQQNNTTADSSNTQQGSDQIEPANDFYTQGNDNSNPKSTTEGNKVYEANEVSKHNKEDDCWVIVNGEVLDVTKFMHDHPGGKKAILLYAGRDATEEFNMLHKKDVVQKYAPETILGKIK